jgi:putative transposase
MVFENQKHYRRNLGRIKGLSKGLSRKVEGSRNWWKNSQKLAKAHYRVACQRQDMLHKMTTQVARTYALIGLEDLNVKGMLANHCLAPRPVMPVAGSRTTSPLRPACSCASNAQ